MIFLFRVIKLISCGVMMYSTYHINQVSNLIETVRGASVIFIEKGRSFKVLHLRIVIPTTKAASARSTNAVHQRFPIIPSNKPNCQDLIMARTNSILNPWHCNLSHIPRIAHNRYERYITVKVESELEPSPT